MQEVMTDYQLRALFSMVLDLLKASETKEEAAEKLQKLIDDK